MDKIFNIIFTTSTVFLFPLCICLYSEHFLLKSTLFSVLLFSFSCLNVSFFYFVYHYNCILFSTIYYFYYLSSSQIHVCLFFFSFLFFFYLSFFLSFLNTLNKIIAQTLQLFIISHFASIFIKIILTTNPL